MITWTLKNTLEARDISTLKLSRQTELSPTTLYRITQGTHQDATLGTCIKIMQGVERISGHPCALEEVVIIEA